MNNITQPQLTSRFISAPGAPVRRRLIAGLLTLAGVAGSAAFAAPASANGEILCSDFPQEPGPPGLPDVPDVFWVAQGETIDGDLIVKEGITCILRGTTVNGNVIVGDGPKEEGEFTGIRAEGGSQINGNVLSSQGTRARLVNIQDSSVDGDIEVGKNAFAVIAGSDITGNFDCRRCENLDAIASTVGGDVTVRRATEGSFILGSTIQGDVEVTHNKAANFPTVISSAGAFPPPGTPVIDPTTQPTVIHGDVVYRRSNGPIVLQYSGVKGDVKVAGNRFRQQFPTLRFESLDIPEDPEVLPALLRNNTVGGDVEFDRNRRIGSVLVENEIDGNLECRRNQPAPTGSNNTADSKTGQCRFL